MRAECQRALASFGAPLPPDVQKHVAGCAQCADALKGYQALGRARASTPAAAALEAAQANALSALASSPRDVPWWTAAAALLACEVFAGAVALLTLGDQRLQAVPGGRTALLLTAALLGVAAAVGAAMSLGRSALWARRASVPYAAAICLIVLATGALLPSPGARAVNCFWAELGFTAIPAAVGLALLTRVGFQSGRAMLATLSAGTVGLLALHLHCLDGSWQHLTLLHLGPWLAAGGLAAWLRGRLPSRVFAP
jgi:hypothetical protein